MSVKFTLTTLAIGCLVGTVIPLPGRSGIRATPQSVAPAGHGGASTTPAVEEERPEPFTLAGMTPEAAAEIAATSPREFFRWMLKTDPQPSRQILEAFFAAWIELDPDAALEAALLLPGRFGYEVRERQFFARQVQLLFWKDPMAALRWVGRIEGVIGHDITLHTRVDLLDKLRALDPHEVTTWLNRTPVAGVSAGMAKAYAEALAEKDPVAALRWSETLSAEYHSAVLPAILLRLEQRDPAAAMEYIRTAPSPVRQYGALSAMDTTSAAAILENMRWLEEEMGVKSYTGINNLMGSLYRKDAQAAIDQVSAMAGTTQGQDAARGLAEAACNHGPTADAVAMIVNLPESQQMDAAHAAMLYRMPGAFSAFLAPLADGSLKGANLDTYIRLLVDFVDGEKGISFGRQHITWTVAELPNDLTAFQKWISENPGPQRDQFVRQAAEAMADKPELRDKVFSNLPKEEIQRIMRGQ